MKIIKECADTKSYAEFAHQHHFVCLHQTRGKRQKITHAQKNTHEMWWASNKHDERR